MGRDTFTDESGTWVPGESALPEEPGFDDPGPRYTAGESIGAGSIGEVRKVYDGRLGRAVAFKQLLVKRAKKPDRKRFTREVRITAQLQHPNIVPVYDAGTTEAGAPFYTMKFVKGRSLDEAIQACERVEDRLALLGHFVDLCQATAYAHARGVIHRDIKPANVMVGQFGETLLLDWGLAKIASQKPIPASQSGAFTAVESGQTQVGTIMGTPSYMSPEQAVGAVDELDARSDVWSLGAVLYELLTAKRPFSGGDAWETIRMVRETEAVPVLDREPSAPPELAAVVDKALQRDRELRYTNAAEMAGEVEAWLLGGRVRAYRYTGWDELRRFLAANRSWVLAAAAVAVIAVGAGLLSYTSVRQERDAALQAEAIATDAQQAAQSHLAEALLASAVSEMEQGRRSEALALAAGSLQIADSPKARGILAGALAGWHPRLLRRIHIPGGCRHAELFDGVMACVGAGGTFVFPVDDPESLLWSSPESSQAMSISPDGKRIGLQTRGGRQAEIRELSTGSLLWEGTPVSTGSDLVLTETPGHFVELRDFRLHWYENYERVATSGPGRLSYDVERSPDGRWLAEASNLGYVAIWDWQTREEVRRLGSYSTGVTDVSWSQDSSQLLLATIDKVASLWHVETGTEQVRFEGATNPLLSAAFSADESLVALGGEDLAVRIADPSTGREVTRLTGFPPGYVTAFFAQDRLWTADRRGLREWILPESKPRHLLHSNQGLSSVDASATQIAMGAGLGLTQLFDHAGQLLYSETLDHNIAKTVALSPDGGRLAVSVSSGIWMIDTQTFDRTALLTNYLPVLAWTADATLWVFDRVGKAWTVNEGEPQSVGMPFIGAQVHDASVSADGRLVVVIGEKSFLMRDGVTKELELGGTPTKLALSPAGDRIAVGRSEDYFVEVIDLDSGLSVAKTGRHGSSIADVAYSHDGRLLATASWDRRARLFDAESGSLLAVLSGHTHRVGSVAFTPDDRRLITGSWDETARVWNLDALSIDPDAILERVHETGLVLEGATIRSVDPSDNSVAISHGAPSSSTALPAKR